MPGVTPEACRRGRLTGLGNNTAACIGVLTNTHASMGLIVLNPGLDLGILLPSLFVIACYQGARHDDCDIADSLLPVIHLNLE
jgi:hypothetical protein